MRALAALCLLLLAARASAQALDDAVLRLLPDERIQVRTSAGVWTETRFVTNRNDSLFFRGPSGPGGLAYDEISALRKRVNLRGTGIPVGMMVGAPMLAYLSATGDGSVSDVLLLGLGGMVIGGFMGGLIGGASHPWKDVYGAAAEPPRSGLPWRFGARVGYVTSSTNQGVAASLIALAGTFGLEMSYFPLPADDVAPPAQVYFITDVARSGATFELHFVGQYVARRGRVRPMLRVGVGPTADFYRYDRYIGDGFGNIVSVSRESNSDFHFGFDANPGVRIGRERWGLTVEGTYHIVAGRGRYSDFAGILIGVNRN